MDETFAYRGTKNIPIYKDLIKETEIPFQLYAMFRRTPPEDDQEMRCLVYTEKDIGIFRKITRAN